MNTTHPGFFRLYLRTFTKPASSLQILSHHPRRLLYGFFALLVPVLGYTAFYIMAWNAGGSPSTFAPWLNLPIKSYFWYDIFLTFPGYYLGWAGAATTVYLLARLAGGSGGFDETLAATGFGAGVATWSSMLHDLTDAILSVAGVIDMQEYEKLLNGPTFWRGLLLSLYAVYFIWFITLFALGIKKCHNLGWFISIVLAFIALAAFQLILLVFIR